MYDGTTQHSNLVDRITRGLDLDYPLIKFSTDQQDWWTIRDAVRGTQIFGGIGSGKSSGSGKTIAKSFLKNGFGGLVLCAKPDERIAWEEYAAATGRSDDLIIFSKGSEYEFNPLEYELTRVGEGAGEIFNLVNLFTEIYKMGNRFSGGSGGGESERFWESALRRCIARAIQLLKLARYEVSISNMIELLSSAPLENEVLALTEMTDEEFLETTRKSFCLSAIFEAGQQDFDEQQEQEYKLVNDYFMRQFATLPDKTRPTILESFLGLAEPFTSGILKQHFAGSTNIRPEMTHEGKIIILDFPVKEFLASGVYAQGIFKLLWQQATERRDVKQQPTPVFLWVDEAQLFLSEYDQIFQTTARSSRACTVFLSQNLSNYYVAIGGRNPRPKADSLLGNLSTKIYHANNDTVTNVWAADTIGKAFMNVSGISVGKNHSSSINQQLHYQVEPKAFTTLKSGGVKNEYQVESIVTVAGREWSDTNNYRKVIFKQK
ncbi:MAG: hypothetical protein AAFP82_10065 [Bacteroidota bacterium]